MKNKFSFLALVFSVVAVALALTGTAQQSAPKETAYERVLRTRTLRCGYTCLGQRWLSVTPIQARLVVM